MRFPRFPLATSRGLPLLPRDGGLDREYDEQFRELADPTDAQVYSAFCEKRERFVASTVAARLPVLQGELDKAFARAEPPPGNFLTLWVLPVAGILLFSATLFVYVRHVGRARAAAPHGGRSAGGAGYLAIAPWLVGVSCLVSGPILAAVCFSLTEYNMIRPPHWIGVRRTCSGLAGP